MRQGSAESSHPSSELSLPDAHYSDGGMPPHMAAFNSTSYHHPYNAGAPYSRDSEHQVPILRLASNTVGYVDCYESEENICFFFCFKNAPRRLFVSKMSTSCDSKHQVPILRRSRLECYEAEEFF
jgi:hypothetical protein